MDKNKLLSSLFLIIVFMTIVVFSCFLTSSLEYAVRDEILVNNFLGPEAKSFKIIPEEDAANWPRALFEIPEHCVISKPLDILGSTVGIYISGSVDIIPEMKEGRFFNERDFAAGGKYAVVGEKILPDTLAKNDKRFYIFENQEYEVIGVMKNRNADDWLGYRSYLNLKALTGNIDYLWVDHFGIDAGDKTHTVYVQLKSGIEQEGMQFKSASIDMIESPLLSVMRKKSFEIMMFTLVFVIFAVNTISVTGYWLDRKRLEIGVKKCCGASSYQIAFGVIKEIMVIALFSFGCGMVLYAIISYALYRRIDLYFFSMLMTMGIVVASSILTSAYPIIKAAKIEPVHMMR